VDDWVINIFSLLGDISRVISLAWLVVDRFFAKKKRPDSN